jgi:NAD(P)-dependent dehydrogenase (short-subunit alcohol dehydrogenase family)
MKSSSAQAASEAAINTPPDDAGPCIILVGSFRSQQSDKNQEGYASTKAGEIGLMHSMAISLSNLGIRVNMISPGKIVVAHESKDGEKDGVTWKDAVTEEDVETHPTNRPGRPEDIVGAADYLVHAGFVTGQNLVVDGGALRVKVKA